MSDKTEITNRNSQFNIDIIERSGDWTIISDATEICAAACNLVLDELEISKYTSSLDVAIMLGDDSAIQSFNGQFRGTDKPTNVLSFPNVILTPDALHELSEDSALIGDVLHLGDVILAIETIIKESEEQGISPESHLTHLVVHGVLHLFGFDHIEDVQAEIMEKKEKEILAKLGVSDPYKDNITKAMGE